MNLASLSQLSKELNICMEKRPRNDFTGFYPRVPWDQSATGGELWIWAKFTYKKLLLIKAQFSYQYSFNSFCSPGKLFLKSKCTVGRSWIRKSECKFQPQLGSKTSQINPSVHFGGWIYKRLTALLSLCIGTLDWSPEVKKKKKKSIRIYLW